MKVVQLSEFEGNTPETNRYRLYAAMLADYEAARHGKDIEACVATKQGFCHYLNEKFGTDNITRSNGHLINKLIEFKEVLQVVGEDTAAGVYWFPAGNLRMHIWLLECAMIKVLLKAQIKDKYK